MRPRYLALGAAAAFLVLARMAAAQLPEGGDLADLPPSLTARQPEETPAEQFRRGLADRTVWKDWISGAASEFKRGAVYWSKALSLIPAMPNGARVPIQDGI